MGRKIFAKTLYTGTEQLGSVLIDTENGKILSIDVNRVPPEDGDALIADQLAPGFIDIHINGGEQFHFTEKVNESALHDISSSSRNTGTAYCLPTLITSPFDNIIKGIRITRDFMKRFPRSGVLGMHLEGPFINPVKRGAHLLKYVQEPNDAGLHDIVNEGKTVIKIITIAPEVFNVSQLQLLLDSDITISAGHSNATYLQARAAFDQGIRLVTHLFNAMSPFTHRSPGLAGAALEDDRVFAPIIADGAHCDFGAVRIASRLKKDKLMLISDALFLGMKVKEFKWGAFEATLQKGQYINPEGNLAGASIPLCDGLRNAIKHLDLSVQEAVEMVTSRPAESIGMKDAVGHVAPGYPAVFTAFTKELTDFKVVDLT